MTTIRDDTVDYGVGDNNNNGNVDDAEDDNDRL